MEKEKGPQRKSPEVHGKGFKTVDSLAHALPSIDVKWLRDDIEISLEILKAKGFTGAEEGVEFDEHGLLVGTYSPNSLVASLKLRTKDDFAILSEKLGEGRNFDTNFTFDPETRKGTVTCTLKKHALVPKLYQHPNRER